MQPAEPSKPAPASHSREPSWGSKSAGKSSHSREPSWGSKSPGTTTYGREHSWGSKPVGSGAAPATHSRPPSWNSLDMIANGLTGLARFRPAGTAAARRPSSGLVELCQAGETSQISALLNGTEKGRVAELVNEASSAGRTALTAAIKGEHPSVVRMLLAAGASLTIADGDGRLPLHVACAVGHVKMVKMLLSAGAL